MSQSHSRREFLQASATTAVTGLAYHALLPSAAAAKGDKAAKVIQVVVWDEQQPQQKEAYPDFLGNWIAKYLAGRPNLAVKSVRLNDPQQGLSDEVLGACQVLIWWGHVRHAEIKPSTARKIVERIKAGTLGLVALHSAHWSTPFVEAMNERTRADTARRFPPDGKEKFEITYVPPPRQYTLPKADALVTPHVVQRKFPEGVTRVKVHLPYCCFPAYRADGKPSFIKVLKPGHPIAKDIPTSFKLPHTEMYDEPFHVPEPDEVIFEERWAGGEWFRSGMVWKLGKGKIFYFRPGHETFGVYKEKIPLRILENAVLWLALQGAGK